MPQIKEDYELARSFWFPHVFEKCGAIAGAMFCRLWAYADDEGRCFMTIPRMQAELGEGYRPIASAKKNLEGCGLISTQTEKFSGGVHTKVTINLKHPYLCKEGTSEMQVPSKRMSPQNASMGTSETQVGVLAKCKNGYLQNASQYTDINTEDNTGVNTEVAPPQNFDPQLEADIAFYEFMQEMNTQGDRAPQIDNHTQNPDFATSANADSPVEPKTVKPKRERKPRIQQPIPQSADEVMPYIDKFLKRHEKEGSYININKEHYAGRILDYYLKDDGTWRDNKNNVIHEPYRKVSAWLSKEYENGKLVRGTGSKPVDIFSDEFDEELRKLEREMSGEDETSPIEASYEVVDDENQNLLEDKDHE